MSLEHPVKTHASHRTNPKLPQGTRIRIFLNPFSNEAILIQHIWIPFTVNFNVQIPSDPGQSDFNCRRRHGFSLHTTVQLHGAISHRHSASRVKDVWNTPGRVTAFVHLRIHTALDIWKIIWTKGFIILGFYVNFVGWKNLVASTLKHIRVRHIGSCPQVGVELNNLWTTNQIWHWNVFKYAILANFSWLSYKLLDVTGSSVHQLIPPWLEPSSVCNHSKSPTERASCYGILVRRLLCLHFLRRLASAGIHYGGLKITQSQDWLTKL